MRCASLKPAVRDLSALEEAVAQRDACEKLLSHGLQLSTLLLNIHDQPRLCCTIEDVAYFNAEQDLTRVVSLLFNMPG